MVIAEKLNYRDCITHLCNGVFFNAILLMASDVWKQIPFPLNFGGFDSLLLLSTAIPILYVESHLVLSINTVVYDVLFGKWQHSQLVKLYCEHSFWFYLLFGATVRGQRVLQFRYYNEDFSKKEEESQYKDTEQSIKLYMDQKEWIRKRSKESELITRDNSLVGLFNGIKIDALIGAVFAILCGSSWTIIIIFLLIFVLALARQYKYSRLNIINRISQCRKHPAVTIEAIEVQSVENKII